MRSTGSFDFTVRDGIYFKIPECQSVKDAILVKASESTTTAFNIYGLKPTEEKASSFALWTIK